MQAPPIRDTLLCFDGRSGINVSSRDRNSVADDELRAYLEKTLPENAHYGHADGATTVEEMLERARRKLR